MRPAHAQNTSISVSADNLRTFFVPSSFKLQTQNGDLTSKGGTTTVVLIRNPVVIAAAAAICIYK